jgi:hypothetical protein
MDDRKSSKATPRFCWPLHYADFEPIEFAIKTESRDQVSQTLPRSAQHFSEVHLDHLSHSIAANDLLVAPGNQLILSNGRSGHCTVMPGFGRIRRVIAAREARSEHE